MSGGTFGTHSGLRATINAWLEDISFRTGMITGAVVLLVIAAACAAVAVLGHGGQAAGALGSRGPATVAPSAAASPVSTAQPPVMPGFRHAGSLRSGDFGSAAVRGRGQRAWRRITVSGAGDRIGAGRGGFRCRPGGLRAGQSRRLAAPDPARLG